MAVTTELTLSGSWEILYTNSTSLDVPIIMTPHEKGANWAVREDTNSIADTFGGHTLEANEDRQRIVEPGETISVRGQQGALLYHSIGS